MNSENKKHNKINFKKNLHIYLELARPHKKYFFVIIFFVFLMSVTKLLQKYVFKELIDNATFFSTGTIELNIFIDLLIFLAIVFGINALIQAVSQWSRFRFTNIMEGKLLLDLKKRYYNHIVHLSHGFHTGHRTGSLISRFTRGSRALERITDILLFDILFLITEFGVAFISLLFVDLTSGIILVLMAIVFIAYSLYLSIIGEKHNVAMNIAEDTEKAFIGDTFTNIETVKFFGKEEHVKKIYFLFGDKTRRKQVIFWDFAKWFASGHGLIIDGFAIILMGFATIRLINGEITIGTLAFIYTVYLSVGYALSNFTWRIRDLYGGITDFDSITKYGEIENDVKDERNSRELKITKGEIIFDNISFSYHNRKVIKNINLKIKPNQKIALVGHSGSGKTTIVKLLYRFYNLEKGKVFIDGQDISKIKQLSLRNKMSIVPQEGILFNDTIYNNIIFSKPNATKKEVVKAIKQAQFYDFVKKLPEKEETIVGERGIKLSGGEKQRLSIARALLADKKILVLDEATSSLDSKTESEIQKALWKLMQGKTTIIIAHRLSTIMHSDKIIVMEKGKIIQEGTHKKLLKQKGPYKELWKLQKNGYLQE
ncbi:MAG: ABC transporter ATP-binding protein [Candidatus ainarchaeum sp.]|nr:ABC transporter ATP-binding protein [Candidatus ainarchaeum sp.]